jgi:hypothetical protein
VIFDEARAVADAVLFEGYALYPYRPSSAKNQIRWQFGVLAPRAWSEAGGGDPWWQETQTLIAPREPRIELSGRLRFLQLQRRDPDADQPRGPGTVPSWDEGLLQEIDFALRWPSGDQAGDDGWTSVEIHPPGGVDRREGAPLAGVSGSSGVAQFRRWPLAGAIRSRVTVCAAGGPPLLQINVRIENLASWVSPGAPRHDAIRGAFLGTHLLLAVAGGDFVSLMDPPPWAVAAAARCRNVGTYPVLAGRSGRRDLILSAPVILEDHPAVAPESPQDLFDATEVDEILTLRILTLSDGEKQEMRAADPRLAALLDRVEQLGPEGMARLHGATRDLRPMVRPPEEPAAPAQISVRGRLVGAGSRIRLQPGTRRADAQDMFLTGMIATVAAVMRDVDDQDCLAVTIDDDPAAAVLQWRPRYHYFYPDEVEPLEVLADLAADQASASGES